MGITITRKSAPRTILPFRHIRIGDPMYFEEMANGSSNNYLKEITCDFNTSCCKTGSVTLEEYYEDEYPEWNYIDVTVYLARDSEQLQTYLDGMWYGDDSVKKQYDLACDTAEFEMEVDDRYMNFHTGADGYYGTMQQMKQYYGLRCTLSFDASLFSFEEIEKTFQYIFPSPKN